MEHLHDIMTLQINNFNSFLNSCNNSVNDSSIQVPPVLYMAQWLLSGSGHIIDHLNLELLLYIHVLGIGKDYKGCIVQLNM